MDWNDLPASAKRAYSDAKRRAKKRGSLILSRVAFCEIWERAGGRCELSGLPLSDEAEVYSPETGYRRLTALPWQPSLDQITPGLGYSRENCQLVCKCVNIGKSSYHTETFKRWVLATAAKIKARG